MKQLQDIQQIINVKAEIALDNDIKAFLKNVATKVGLIEFLDFNDSKIIKITTIKNGAESQESVRSAFWNSNNSIGLLLKNVYLEKYIEKESEEFIKQIEELKIKQEQLENYLDNQ